MGWSHTVLWNFYMYLKKKVCSGIELVDSYSGFVPNSAFAKLWCFFFFFPPPCRFQLCEASQLPLQCTVKQQWLLLVLICRSCCSWGAVPPWGLMAGGVPCMEGLRKPGWVWAEVGGENDPGRLWTLKSLWTSRSIQSEQSVKKKGKKRKWKNRLIKRSIRCDTVQIWETTGKNVNRISFRVLSNECEFEKDTDLTPDSNGN